MLKECAFSVRSLSCAFPVTSDPMSSGPTTVPESTFRRLLVRLFRFKSCAGGLFIGDGSRRCRIPGSVQGRTPLSAEGHRKVSRRHWEEERLKVPDRNAHPEIPRGAGPQRIPGTARPRCIYTSCSSFTIPRPSSAETVVTFLHPRQSSK